MSAETSEVVRCAGAVVFDHAGRLLLVRRGHEPSLGLWCEPSGRCEAGESAAQACVREAREETGLDVEVVRRVGAVAVGRYEIEDYLCTVVGGELRAGDDASEVRWVTLAQLRELPLVDGLDAVLSAWGSLPRC